MVSIRTPLKNGSVVEILTSNRQKPKREWLHFVVSAKARHRIRAALRQQDCDKYLCAGKEAIQNILQPYAIKLETLLKKQVIQGWMQRNNLQSAEDIYLAEGFSKINFKRFFVQSAEDLGIVLNPHTYSGRT